MRFHACRETVVLREDGDPNKVNLLYFFVFVIGDNIMLLGHSAAPLVRADQCVAVASPSFSLPYQFSSLSKSYITSVLHCQCIFPRTIT